MKKCYFIICMLLIACKAQTSSSTTSSNPTLLAKTPLLLEEQQQNIESLACSRFKDPAGYDNLVNYLKDNDIPGNLIPCEQYLTQLKDVWSRIHPILKSQGDFIKGIYFVSKLNEARAITLGYALGSIVVIDERVFKETIENLDKEKNSIFFGKKLEVEYRSKNTNKALEYVLTHELSHVLDSQFHIISESPFGKSIFSSLSINGS